MGKMIDQIWIRKTRWTPRAPSSLWRYGPDPAHTIPACGKPHKKALQKRALDHSYAEQNPLALWAATTEGVQLCSTSFIAKFGNLVNMINRSSESIIVLI